MIVKDDTIKFKTSLKNLDGIFTGAPIAYHLHSGYVGGGLSVSAGDGNLCGGDFTVGHYDPTLACGGASTAKECPEGETEGCCTLSRGGDRYANCGEKGICEVGDLSGRYGTIPIEDGEAEADDEDDLYEEFLSDYLGDGEVGLYNTWGSVVFHDTGAGGARRLCGNLYEA